jgi:hypothetical protein
MLFFLYQRGFLMLICTDGTWEKCPFTLNLKFNLDGNRILAYLVCVELEDTPLPPKTIHVLLFTFPQNIWFVYLSCSYTFDQALLHLRNVKVDQTNLKIHT